MNQDIKKEINLIYNNKNLTNEEKSKLIFELLNPNLNKNKEIKKETVFSFDKYGCKHYKRGCLILAKCCNQFVPCRLCHNEKLDHEINRFETEKMKCKFCDKVQNVSDKCIECNEIMGIYYCGICKLWSNDVDKKIFHCDECGICRVGNKDDYFHCKKCNICICSSAKETHVCIEDTMHKNCPICQLDLFNSVENVQLLKCGHSIHTSCFKEYISSNNYQCPLCKISLFDMKSHWENIDSFLENQKMPDEFNNTISYNYCNDCKKKSYCKYHFIYNKCKYCNGYNTNQPIFTKDFSKIMNIITKTQLNLKKKFCNLNK